MDMRKGTVLIITTDIHNFYKDFKMYLNNSGLEFKTSSDFGFELNGYKIIIRSASLTARGYRPEILYIDSQIETDNIFVEEMKITGLYSNRKEYIRTFNKIEDIDIKEFSDDDYAMVNYIDETRYNEWNKIIRRINEQI